MHPMMRRILQIHLRNKTKHKNPQNPKTKTHTPNPQKNKPTSRVFFVSQF